MHRSGDFGRARITVRNARVYLASTLILKDLYSSSFLSFHIYFLFWRSRLHALMGRDYVSSLTSLFHVRLHRHDGEIFRSSKTEGNIFADRSRATRSDDGGACTARAERRSAVREYPRERAAILRNS